MLSIQRRKLLFDPDVSLREFLPHDERIAAHWDGLAVGAADSAAMAKNRIESPDPWDVYAAARVWIELGRPETNQILEMVAAADEAAVPGWREALRRVPRDVLRDRFPDGPPPGGAPVVLDVLVFALGWHGLVSDHLLAELVGHVDHSVRRSAARAIGWGLASFAGGESPPCGFSLRRRPGCPAGGLVERRPGCPPRDRFLVPGAHPIRGSGPFHRSSPRTAGWA